MTAVVAAADPSELRDRVGRLAEKMGADAEALITNPPSGWVLGTVDQATEQLEAIREAGVDRIMCQQLVHDDLDAIELLGRQLAPRLR
jgi:alkanesulfonate monooxygenase SsuD/methylene tetrahydromethanopterin reductase-like flavin-dependent oxidoreductase (luciferase family)